MTSKIPKRIDITREESPRLPKGDQLLIDGNPIDARQAELTTISPFMGERNPIVPFGRFAAHILDGSLSDAIRNYCLDDISSSIGVLSFPFHPAWNQFVDRVYFVRHQDGEAEGWAFVVSLMIWPDHWANPYTVSDYEDALLEIGQESREYEPFELFGLRPWSSRNEEEEEEERDGSYWHFGFLSRTRSTTNNIGKEIEFYADRFNAISGGAARRILRNRRDALVTFFEFPAALKTSCEQYLVYFIQFLEDLGIKADSEIKQQAGCVMFSVSPKDGPAALTKIKEALDVYLRLPLDPSFSATAAQFPDLAVTQLRANVFFLQSQLELARAVLQAKDATIQALDLIVFKQRQLLTAAKTTQQKESSVHRDEPLLGNTVSITEYEVKGIKINFPHILRQLKRTFSPDSNE